MLTLSSTPRLVDINTAAKSAPGNSAAGTEANRPDASDPAISSNGTAAKAAFSAMLAAMRSAAQRSAANAAPNTQADEALLAGREAVAGLAPGAEAADLSDGQLGTPGTGANDAASLLAMLDSVADPRSINPDGLSSVPGTQPLPLSPMVSPIGLPPATSTSAATNAAQAQGVALDGGDATTSSRGPSGPTDGAAPTPPLPFDNMAALGTGTGNAAGVQARSAGAARAAQVNAMALSAADSAAAPASAHKRSGEGGMPPGTPAANASAATAATAAGGAQPGMLWSVPPGAAALPAPVAVTIATPVHSPYFAEETAQQVTWLTKHGIEQARIHVTPADMGPIEIRIAIEDGEALINFAVTHPESAAAIEDAMPRLRDMLAAAGISLGQTSVGGEDSAFGAASGSADGNREPAGRRSEGLALAQRDATSLADGQHTARSSQRVSTQLLDLFA